MSDSIKYLLEESRIPQADRHRPGSAPADANGGRLSRYRRRLHGRRLEFRGHFNLCGHGHFDMPAYLDYFSGQLTDQDYDERELAMALAGLPSVPSA
jgi:hypothetical protein